MLHPRLRDIYTSCNLCNTDYDLIWKVSSLLRFFHRLLSPGHRVVSAGPGTFTEGRLFSIRPGTFSLDRVLSTRAVYFILFLARKWRIWRK